jgi:hypothetical protein
MPKTHTENLTGVHPYHDNLAQQIDDAEWLCDPKEDLDYLHSELRQHIKQGCSDSDYSYTKLFG